MAGIALFVFGLSFYFRDFPREPDPQTGRTYELNDHGSISYLTWFEYVVQAYSVAGGIGLGMLSLPLQNQAQKKLRETQGH